MHFVYEKQQKINKQTKKCTFNPDLKSYMKKEIPVTRYFFISGFLYLFKYLSI